MDVFHIQDGKNHETKLELVKNLCHENEFLTPTFLKESWRSLSTAQRESLKVWFFNFIVKRQIKEDLGRFCSSYYLFISFEICCEAIASFHHWGRVPPIASTRACNFKFCWCKYQMVPSIKAQSMHFMEITPITATFTFVLSSSRFPKGHIVA